MLERALQKAKQGDEKKVSINFQVPISLKEEFDALCKKNSVSLTAMLNSLIEIALEESKTTTQNIASISQLKNTIMEMNSLIKDHVNEEDIGFDPQDIKAAAESQLKKLV
jgi:glutathionyl-hydroquinone reductase